MNRRLGFTISLILLVGVLGFSFRVQVAQGYVYIDFDGSVVGTDKIVRNGDVYTFTGDINDYFKTYVDNIVIDGDGHTLSGTNLDYRRFGVNLEGRGNVTVKNLRITGFDNGVYINWGSGNVISGNTFTNNSQFGIYVSYSSDTIISGNILNDHPLYAIEVLDSPNTVISGNIITNNRYTMQITDQCDYGKVDGNVIVNNQNGIYLGSNNTIISRNTIANNAGTGIFLSTIHNITISSNNITGNGHGIDALSGVFSCTWYDNTIADNDYGIQLSSSKNNTISGNTITNNSECGINVRFNECRNNTISNNSFVHNYKAVWISGASYNTFYHNSFVDSTHPGGHIMFDFMGGVDYWNSTYPEGGNYWSGYEARYPDAMELDDSGIWDTAYVLNGNNKDNFPLMIPRVPTTRVFTTHSLQVEIYGNSSVSAFQFQEPLKQLSFNVTGPKGTTGFCRVAIPTSLIWCSNPDEWIVMIGGIPTPPINITETADTTYIYFTYNHSTKTVQIIGTTAVPEFPSAIILLLLMMLSILAVVLANRRIAKSKL